MLTASCRHEERMPTKLPRRRMSHSKTNITATPAAAVLALQRDLPGRFVSSGGRPADSAPTIRRLVTVRKSVWKELQLQAARLSRLGARISVGQLAAVLLERSVSELGS